MMAIIPIMVKFKPYSPCAAAIFGIGSWCDSLLVALLRSSVRSLGG